MFFILLLGSVLLSGCEQGEVCSFPDNPFPDGTYEVRSAHFDALVGSEAVIENDTVTFTYTDEEGNQWEVTYAITDE